MTKVLVTEDYLGDIADAIRAKNGSSDTYTPGQMAGAIANLPGASVLVAKTITVNGEYDPEDDNADGYNSVTVNVPGGGGSNVLFGDSVPASSLGTDGDYYIRSGNQTRIIRIDITKVARRTDTNFTYYGSRAISIVCKDDSDNVIEISPYIVSQYYWTGQSLMPQGSSRNVFKANIGSYIENNGLPAHYAASYIIPESYSIHKIKLTRRNASNYHDFWVSFNIYQCDEQGNNLSLLLSKENLVESDWNDPDSFTEFSPTGQFVNTPVLHEVYNKQNGAWVAI